MKENITLFLHCICIREILRKTCTENVIKHFIRQYAYKYLSER